MPKEPNEPQGRPGARDLGRTRENILTVAEEHFSRNGFFGSRIDEIAAQTATTKRMIYYCFGSKDGLFAACLHAGYARIRAYEQGLHLDLLDPVEAIDTYVRGTIRYHETHPQLARLVRAENLLGARHIDVADRELNRAIVETLDDVLGRGREAGVFRAGVSGIEIHMAVTAIANYRITNESTFEALFGFDTRDPARMADDLGQYSSMILGWLRP